MVISSDCSAAPACPLTAACTLFSIGFYKGLINPQAEDKKVVRSGRIFGFIIAVPISLFIITFMLSKLSVKDATVKHRLIISLIYGVVGGAVVEPELVRACEAEFGCRVMQIYGMSEGIITCTRGRISAVIFSKFSSPIGLPSRLTTALILSVTSLTILLTVVSEVVSKRACTAVGISAGSFCISVTTV